MKNLLKNNIIKRIREVRDQIESDLIDVVASKYEGNETDITDTVIQGLRIKLAEANSFIRFLLMNIQNNELLTVYKDSLDDFVVNLLEARITLREQLRVGHEKGSLEFKLHTIQIEVLKDIKSQFVMEFKKVDGVLEAVGDDDE